MVELPEQQLKTLKVIQDLHARGEEVSHASVASELGLTKAGAQRHMRELVERGLIIAPKVIFKKWPLTAAGKKIARRS